MRKLKFNRICPSYADYGYTVYDLNHNILHNGGMILNSVYWAKEISDLKITEPFEVSASYTINYVDTWGRHLLPHEITNTEKYNSLGYPIVHSVKRHIQFWVAPDYSDTKNLIKQLKKQNRNTDGLLIVNNNLHEVHPDPSVCIPFKILRFLECLPRKKR